MKSMLPYIVFSGNCREALEFYSKVLGGQIKSITSFSESPMPVSDDLGNRIFDSEFTADGLRFKASDDLPGHQVQSGTNISLFVSFSEDEERQSVFNDLAEEGKILFPLDNNFGMLKDKFGIQWMLVPGK